LNTRFKPLALLLVAAITGAICFYQSNAGAQTEAQSDAMTNSGAAMEYDVVVVGAGMGGLSAGAHLAVKGMKVLVLEQNHKVGGCTTSFSRGEFNFDAALHEMAAGGPGTSLGKLLEAVGVDKKIELIRIPELYRTIAPGVDFTYSADYDTAVKDLSEKWPAEKEGIVAFHKEMDKLHTQMRGLQTFFRAGAFKKIGLLMMAPFRQPKYIRYRNAILDDVLDNYFQDEALKTVISQYWVYYGPPPSKLWAPIFMLANITYLREGAWHIKGSSQALSNAYAERIRELGGTVKTGALVTKILVADGKARGVETQDGETYKARYVVSNADPFQTSFKLVGEEKFPKSWNKKIRSMKPSNSLFGVYLGLDVPPSHWGVKDHEIFYNGSLDPDVNFQRMMDGEFDKGAASITFYTNLGDPFYSPEGKSVLVLHAFSKADLWPKERKAYLKMKEEAADKLIALTENFLPGLRNHIEVKEIITPLTLEEFTMSKDGIPYGWDFIPEQNVEKRLMNDTPIEGLYLAGSWASPGHGVSTAQISGWQAACLILDREGIE